MALVNMTLFRLDGEVWSQIGGLTIPLANK
jgi:hypothetical protein